MSGVLNVHVYVYCIKVIRDIVVNVIDKTRKRKTFAITEALREMASVRPLPPCPLCYNDFDTFYKLLELFPIAPDKVHKLTSIDFIWVIYY